MIQPSHVIDVKGAVSVKTVDAGSKHFDVHVKFDMASNGEHQNSSVHSLSQPS